MTWTVFEHQGGHNATTDMAPGRGGYKYVLVPAGRDIAVEWWDGHVGPDVPRHVRPNPNAEPLSGDVGRGEMWEATEYADEEEARKACGEMELDEGGIGSPMSRPYTWDELQGRLDVKVVESTEVNEHVPSDKQIPEHAGPKDGGPPEHANNDS